MIKAGGKTRDGRPLLVIGLSRANVERLLKNQPIRFAADPLGVACEVLILGGETEDDITEDLRAIAPLTGGSTPERDSAPSGNAPERVVVSWWVGLEIDTGGEEAADLCDRNVTYNVGGLFRLVLPHPEGLRGYDKAPASEAGGIFQKAAEELAALPDGAVAHLEPANGWGSRDSAVADLRWLAAACASHPRGQVYVH